MILSWLLNHAATTGKPKEVLYYMVFIYSLCYPCLFLPNMKYRKLCWYVRRFRSYWTPEIVSHAFFQSRSCILSISRVYNFILKYSDYFNQAKNVWIHHCITSNQMEVLTESERVRMLCMNRGSRLSQWFPSYPSGQIKEASSIDWHSDDPSQLISHLRPEWFGGQENLKLVTMVSPIPPLFWLPPAVTLSLLLVAVPTSWWVSLLTDLVPNDFTCQLCCAVMFTSVDGRRNSNWEGVPVNDLKMQPISINLVGVVK